MNILIMLHLFVEVKQDEAIPEQINVKSAGKDREGPLVGDEIRLLGVDAYPSR